MDAKNIEEYVIEFQEKDPLNKVSAELAKDPAYVGRNIFEGAECGISDANDEIYASLRNNADANIDLMQPEEWLPGAKSVISVFMPFEKWITEENIGGDWPTNAWLHGRIEGQTAMRKLVKDMEDMLEEKGYKAVAPSIDSRLKVNKEILTSNWSERHVAFICGIGTFGLSRGIITELGMAGRLISVVTTLPMVPTPRPYTDLLEYCDKCGSCIKGCPIDAISFEHLKDNKLCDGFLNEVLSKEAPYYGCGKCQSGMPCAYGIPGKS